MGGNSTYYSHTDITQYVVYCWWMQKQRKKQSFDYFVTFYNPFPIDLSLLIILQPPWWTLFPLSLQIVFPKIEYRYSISPRFTVISIVVRISRSTQNAVVLCFSPTTWYSFLSCCPTKQDHDKHIILRPVNNNIAWYVRESLFA